MFQLIDGILPFEACLYHQILPLSLDGTRLNLGMVNPKDTAALDYVRRILAYMNCSLVPQPLSAEKHQAALSAYLNHTGQIQRSLQTATYPSAVTESHPLTHKNDTQATLFVDRPEQLDEPTATAKSTPVPSKPPISQALEAPRSRNKGVNSDASTPLNLPLLEVQAKHLTSPVEVLATLPPKQLLQELLARILAGGIGRLYFERHQDRGRILWSQNGVLQSVLEGLDSAVFQGVINELKLLTHLPLLAVEKPKQVEIERLYQQNRLLLRLRVMPGTHGEEATLQVLRGAALKFHQQKQLETLSRDALTIAQQLQRKMNEIKERTQQNPSLGTKQLEAIPALDELLKNLESQMEALKVMQDNEQEGEESAVER